MALSWVRNWVSLTALMAGVSSGLYSVLARNLGWEMSAACQQHVSSSDDYLVAM